MSRESSLVPTNLLDSPRVAPLLPDQKLILIALWAAPYINSAGAGVVPHRPFSSTLGLSQEATKTGLKNLRDAQLILLDENEEEIFILDWFRWHKFGSPAQKSMLKIDLDKIN